MSILTPREIEFLNNSNAIASITNLGYSSSENASAQRGHAGAFRDSQQLARTRTPLTPADVYRWQKLIAEETTRDAHPDKNIHAAPVIDAFVEEVQQALRNATKDTEWKPSPVTVATIVGDLFYRFESLRPFGVANGRTARILVSYLATYLGQPIIVFRLSDKSEYDAARRSAIAMRAFVGKKMCEARFDPMGRLMLYAGTSGDTDRYADHEGRRFLIQGDELRAQVVSWRQVASM